MAPRPSAIGLTPAASAALQALGFQDYDEGRWKWNGSYYEKEASAAADSAQVATNKADITQLQADIAAIVGTRTLDPSFVTSLNSVNNYQAGLPNTEAQAIQDYVAATPTDATVSATFSEISGIVISNNKDATTYDYRPGIPDTVIETDPIYVADKPTIALKSELHNGAEQDARTSLNTTHRQDTKNFIPRPIQDGKVMVGGAGETFTWQDRIVVSPANYFYGFGDPIALDPPKAGMYHEDQNIATGEKNVWGPTNALGQFPAQADNHSSSFRAQQDATATAGDEFTGYKIRSLQQLDQRYAPLFDVKRCADLDVPTEQRDNVFKQGEKPQTTPDWDTAPEEITAPAPSDNEAVFVVTIGTTKPSGKAGFTHTEYQSNEAGTAFIRGDEIESGGSFVRVGTTTEKNNLGAVPFGTPYYDITLKQYETFEPSGDIFNVVVGTTHQPSIMNWPSNTSSGSGLNFKVTEDPDATAGITSLNLPDGTQKQIWITAQQVIGENPSVGGSGTLSTEATIRNDGGVISLVGVPNEIRWRNTGDWSTLSHNQITNVVVDSMDITTANIQQMLQSTGGEWKPDPDKVNTTQQVVDGALIEDRGIFREIHMRTAGGSIGVIDFPAVFKTDSEPFVQATAHTNGHTVNVRDVTDSSFEYDQWDVEDVKQGGDFSYYAKGLKP